MDIIVELDKILTFLTFLLLTRDQWMRALFVVDAEKLIVLGQSIHG